MTEQKMTLAQLAYLALSNVTSGQLLRAEKETRDAINVARSELSLLISAMQRPVTPPIEPCPVHKVELVPRTVLRQVDVFICPKDDCLYRSENARVREG